MAGTEEERVRRAAAHEDVRRLARERQLSADRASGRWRVIGGTSLAIIGIIVAALVIWKIELRPTGGIGLAVPIGLGIVYAMGGLRMMRAGDATIEPDWLETAGLSAESRTFRLLSSGTGKYETWAIDGMRLIDPTGREHHLPEATGGRFMENNAPAGWSGELKLLFPDKRKVKVKAYERHRGQNEKNYRELYQLIHTVLQTNNPGLEFKNGQGRAVLLGLVLGAVIVGVVIGVSYLVYLFVGG